MTVQLREAEASWARKGAAARSAVKDFMLGAGTGPIDFAT